MTNSLALTLEQERFGNGRNRKESTNSALVTNVKKVTNDSLFFFGIFLVAFVVLQFIPTTAGLIDNLHIGLNEVAVSFLGFVNVFFVKLFNKGNIAK
jgi:hypothetical protein